MNKQEFINKLQIALNGRLSPALVQENINYYEDYINTQIRMGKSENDVLESLGDPRLIARTIVETSVKSGNSTYESAEYQNAGYRDTGYQNTNYRNQDSGFGQRKKMFRIPVWVWIIITIIVVMLIFSMIFSVLSFLAPVILPIIVVVFLVKLFRDWLN